MSYAHDILSGLNYIHQQGIIHGDIKVENILTQSSNRDDEFPILKICDFGVSQRVGEGGKVPNGMLGTYGYMAPELGLPENGKPDHVDQSIDMWAFGIVMYELAASYKPTAFKGFKYGRSEIPFAK